MDVIPDYSKCGNELCRYYGDGCRGFKQLLSDAKNIKDESPTSDREVFVPYAKKCVDLGCVIKDELLKKAEEYQKKFAK